MRRHVRLLASVAGSRARHVLPIVLALALAGSCSKNNNPTEPSPLPQVIASDLRAGTGLTATAGRIVTVDYTGWAGPLRPMLHRLASLPSMNRLRAAGILARTRTSNRIMLSPEGNSCSEMKALTRALLSRGLRTFTFSFHSPSVEPGHTPYVRTQQDLSVFLASIEEFCEFFLGQLGGRAATHLEYRQHLLTSEATT